MKNNRRAGFTLLEVLVATVIMGVAVTALIVGLTQSVKNAGRLADYDRAVMLARTRMNDLRNRREIFPSKAASMACSLRIRRAIPSGWNAYLKPYDVPPNAGAGSRVLQQIALEVWWLPATGGRRTMHLESYRAAAFPSVTN